MNAHIEVVSQKSRIVKLMGLLQHLRRYLIALIDLSWMVEFFYYAVICDIKKASTCSSKFLSNFIKKAFMLNNGCNAIYCTVFNMLAIGSHC